MSKTYTKRTNAKRAAIAAGIPADQVEITLQKETGNAPRFGFKQKSAQLHAKAVPAKKGKATAAERERRNGVARPRAGGLCAHVWAWLDKNPKATLPDVRTWAEKNGTNVNNAACELYAWRKYNAQEVTN